MNTNKIELRKGDFITGVKWHSHTDNSYIGDVMEVLDFDPCSMLIKVKSWYNNSRTMILCQTRLEVKKVGQKFAENKDTVGPEVDNVTEARRLLGELLLATMSGMGRAHTCDRIVQIDTLLNEEQVKQGTKVVWKKEQ